MTADTLRTLTAYLAGEHEDDAAFEDELLEGRFDGDELTELSSLLVGIREAAFLGILNLIVPPEHVERMRSAGYVVRTARLEEGKPVTTDVSGEFDLLFVEFIVDLSGVTHIESETCDSSGVAFKRSAPLQVQEGSRSVTGYCHRDLARASARELPGGVVTRLYDVTDGKNRLLAEYFGRLAMESGDPESG